MTRLISIPPTGSKQGQLPYYRKFEITATFVNAMSEVLAISDLHRRGPAFKWFHLTKHILSYAFIDYPHPGIDYGKVLVSRGNLWNTHNATAKATTDGITFTWANDTGIGGAKGDDQCLLVAYCETLNQCVFSNEGDIRQFGEALLAVPEFASHKVHTWLSFMAADGQRIANSVYTGEVIGS